MTEPAKYNFPKAEKVQIFEQVDTYIENQSPQASNPEVKAAVSELQALFAQLQAQHPEVTTESSALTIIDAEFTEIQPSPNHKLTTLRKQLLNPERHFQATKAALGEIARHYLEESIWAKAGLTYLDKLSEDPKHGA
ncbi:hypothetical protein [Trichothermofontia sp.]